MGRKSVAFASLAAAVFTVAASVFVDPSAGQEPVPAPAVPKLALPERLLIPEQAYLWADADVGPIKADLERKAAPFLERDPYEAKAFLALVEQYRWFWIGNIHPDEREDYVTLMDAVMNHLSTRRGMVFAEAVPGTGNALVRVKLDEYEIATDWWEDLGRTGSGPIVSVRKKDNPEPYFHLVVKKKKTVTRKVRKQVPRLDAAGRQLYYLKADGTRDLTRPATEEREVEEKVEADAEAPQLEHAPFLDNKAVVSLSTAVKSDFPVLRFDWFLANAIVGPAYNKRFGFKTLADVQKLARFQKIDLDTAVKGIVSDSDEVALHQRATLFVPTSLGQWCETFDYFTSVDEDNLLEDLRLQRRDASEIIFSLRNGLQCYALINGSDKNEVIDFADPNIAIDTRTVWRNKLVWTALSCMTCHDQGLKNVTDEVRLMANDKVALLVKKKDDYRAVVDLFETPVEEPVLRGQAQFAKSINLATRGKWTPKQFSAKLAAAHLRYEQEKLDVGTAAMEVGSTPEQIADLLGRARGSNHTLTQLFLKRPVRRDQWESKGFQQLALATYNEFHAGKKAGALPPTVGGRAVAYNEPGVGREEGPTLGVGAYVHGGRAVRGLAGTALRRW